MLLGLAGCSTSSSGPDLGTISGHVYDMLTGLPLEDVNVTGGGSDATTDDEGYFFLTVEAGAVTLTIERASYIADEAVITVEPAQQVDEDFLLFPLPACRFVLTWGEQPQNLDAHVWVPMGTGTYDHIWHGDVGDADSPPYTWLPYNVSSGFGPETAYIRPGTGDYYAGSYHIAVRHTAGDLSLPESGAQIRVYRGTTLLQTITAPPGTAHVGWYWYVGMLNCRTGQWTLVNTYSADPPLPDA
jgi:hypothetical protein